LAFAAVEGRALLTLNRRHFIHLHNIHQEHAGIIVCTFDPDFAAQANRIHEALETMESTSSQLIRINRASP
jgi:hypothetical protein